jgi:hypothetical protein
MSRDPMSTAMSAVTSPGTRAAKAAPHLSQRGLTIMLVLMCLVPLVTLYILWRYLPKVYEGQLQAAVLATNLPASEFYSQHYSQRPPVEGGEIVVQNNSPQDWTHLNIQVNRYYQLYDSDVIPAGHQRSYPLNRFLSLTGARFSLRYNQLKSVRIYARLPTKDRATYYHSFNDNGE